MATVSPRSARFFCASRLSFMVSSVSTALTKATSAIMPSIAAMR